jgi:2-octaprenyl-6-methoxyphenol hydroxylase
VSETLSLDVCVVGAGPVGGTLACRLATAGVRTAIIDRAPLPPMEDPAFDGRAYAIAAGPRALLAEAGLWTLLPEPPCPIRDIRVTDGRIGRQASRLHLHFAASDLGDGAGPFGWMVEARALRVALNRHMATLPALRVFAPAMADITRTQAGVIVRIAGAPAIRCRLVVAAEGRRSPLRDAAGIGLTRLPYRQTGIVCAVAHTLPHDNVALEQFLPAGPFAQLPMSATGESAHVSASVWTEQDARARLMLGLDDTRFAREIQRRLGEHLGAVRPIGRRWSYPLAAMIVHRYTDTRLALVGDAAHGVHPIAGQGLNLGFRDVGVLAGLILHAVKAGLDPGAPVLLARYQRQQRPENLAMLLGMDALDRLFSNDIPPVRLARDIGIAAVHRIPPLRRMFMQQAMR